jgi:hypothetical protein
MAAKSQLSAKELQMLKSAKRKIAAIQKDLLNCTNTAKYFNQNEMRLARRAP